ncbi:Aminotran-1-2 domain-containing protein [Mycena indigotica]|uniref:histidinol-phosphate transaminase n=1 Tax=Mycena indigotica TaxID=2126181 RepID=A0A8H6W488_9AGAR|nr:Aminotran-1-2 domain-containing protein [Mycena indigotica]KAF7301173.1 Aminotran-1-2 domain-containing protein [Mycena indigotica]
MAIHGLPQSTPTSGKPLHFDLLNVIRPNILQLHPYRAARDDYSSGILVDANENALGHSIDSTSDSLTSLHLHRYPDPAQPEIKARIAALRGFPESAIDHIFLGVGSDEVVDLLMRVCVTPGREKILTTPPTYGMYAVSAQINDIGVVRCPLELSGTNGEGGENGRFSVKLKEVKAAIDADPLIKLVFLCSPGNPTGTLIPIHVIKELLDYPNFKGIVVVDEAYIDFATPEASAVSLVKDYGNICVMQTLSKSFGLAGVRLGVAIAQPPLIQVLSNTKAPYNISTPTSHIALAALSTTSINFMRSKMTTLIGSRAALLQSLSTISEVGAPLGSNDANFVLVPILDKDGSGNPDNIRAQRLYKLLAEENGVVVRFRGNEPGCTGCVRITVGTEDENGIVVSMIRKVLSEI